MLIPSEFELTGEADPRRSDDLLVLRIRQGDDDAATALYQKYAVRLKGLADRKMSAVVRRMCEPDDIVQSAFRSLFRGVNAGAYEAPEGSSLWSLLVVIAIRKVQRKATRNKSVAATSLSESPSGIPEGEDFQDQLSPEQFESGLREAIEILKPAEREVVEFRVQGFSVEEISDRLHKSCRTVERTLQRIRKKLAEELDFTGSLPNSDSEKI